MITKARYLQLTANLARFEAWRNGRTSYSPSQVPKEIPQVSNAQRSAIEAYEFYHNPPDRYFLYVKRHDISAGVVDPHKVTVTTWTGQKLGNGRLGRMYRSNFGNLCYPITFVGINGYTYYGTYYHSTGNYARVKRAKTK